MEVQKKRRIALEFDLYASTTKKSMFVYSAKSVSIRKPVTKRFVRRIAVWNLENLIW